jgi:DNA-binding XRE family transcriptional regulator
MESTFGSRLKEFRATTGLNQEEFGKKIGLARTTISNVEIDKYVINVQNLILLIQAFPKLNIYWLLINMGNMIRTTDVDDVKIEFLGELLREKDERIKALEELLGKYRQ